MNNITIVGAGLTGMIAAHIFPQARVLEATPEAELGQHRALLRFRSEVVSEATGIPFRAVTVRKGIWDGNRFIEPNICAANSYSMKCTGKILPRSVWNVDACQRWIAPMDFIQQLRNNLGDRVEYGAPFNFKALPTAASVISTVPMGIVAKQVGEQAAPTFSFSPIKVYRLDLGPTCDVHQTVYFPFTDTLVYRASITGSTFIIEAVDDLQQGDLVSVQLAFGLGPVRLNQCEISSQRYGKIAPIDESFRRGFIYRMSDQFGVYSLGRFGTWRNILLDDVVHDCAVIKRLLLADSYARGRARAV